jgi:glycosyltransferase involved in cell wall biosynthesis
MNSVLWVGNRLSMKGGSRAVGEDLTDRLAAAGWHVLSVSSRRNRILRLIDMTSTAWRRRRDYKVAHVEVYSGPAFLWAEAVCWVLRRARKPYALTLHGGRLPEFSLCNPRRAERLLQSAELVTAPSAHLQIQMRRYRKDIQVVPNGLEIERYPFRLRDQPGPRLIWLRAFQRIYNPVLAVRVLASLRPHVPDVSLTMIGPDKGDGTLARVEAAARCLGVSDRLRITGGVPKQDVPKWLQEGDVFLNTAEIDNTPVSVMEAMACGLCVVTTDVGGMRALVEHRQEALLTPSGDAERMAEAIRELLTRNALAAHLSMQARRKAEQFDWSRIVPRWTELLEGLTRCNRRAALEYARQPENIA